MNRTTRVIATWTFALSLFAPITPAIAAGGHGPHWDYDGKEGPEHWGELDAAFQTCKSGKKQSPVDITSGKPEKLGPIQFDYKPSPIAIINNGHLGMVRQWQELFYEERYSQVYLNGDVPDYVVGHAGQVLAYAPDDRGYTVYPFGTRQSQYASDARILAEITTEQEESS